MNDSQEMIEKSKKEYSDEELESVFEMILENQEQEEKTPVLKKSL